MNIKLIIIISLLVGSFLSFGVGGYLLFHSIEHIGDTTEARAEASISHIGSIGGSPHVVAVFLGLVMVAFSVFIIYRLYTGIIKTPAPLKSKTQHKRWQSKITSSGKEIAELMRLRKQEKEFDE